MSSTTGTGRASLASSGAATAAGQTDDLQAACTTQEDHSLEAEHTAAVSGVQQQTIGASGSHQRDDLSFQDAGSEGGAADTSAASDLAASDSAGTGAAAEKAAKRLLIEKRVEERRKQLALERQLQQQEQEAAVARGIAEDNEGARPVFVSGATGALCSVVNGYYEPTEEKGVDGRVMYRKVGDGGVWIEHFEGHWAIKYAMAKGKDDSEAYLSNCYCTLESCVSRVWKVYDYIEEEFLEQPSVKISTGEEAEQQVGLLCTHARFGTTRRFARRRGAAALHCLTRCLFVLRRGVSMLLELRGALRMTTKEPGLCLCPGRRAVCVRL